MNAFLRLIAGSLSLPAGLALGGVQRWIDGPAAVLDVPVRRMRELMERQEFHRRLRRAALDPSIAAVFLRLQEPPGGFAACHDLRTTIAAIRRSGKAVYALVEAPGNALVWVASACDRVFVIPSGELGLVGLGVEMTFFGAALERLGLTPDFEAAGAYKSFGEPFTRSFPSAANQEAMGELIEGLHNQIVDDIASGRELELDAVRALMARAPLSASEAIDGGLVDQIAYADEAEKWLEDKLGSVSKLVEFGSWGPRDAWVESIEHWGEGAHVVAVLHCEGNIVMEHRGSGGPTIQARKVVPILRKLREDERVSAVVLHINSPGGHAVGSDLMWREVEEMVRAKPVVACYEDVSASGGVYMSAPATEIFARPTSLTGSIGVFGGKVVAGEGMRKIGVHVHEVVEAPNANMYSPHRAFTDSQRARFRSQLQRFYDGFVERVADGRGLEADAIEPHCRGRVWTGQHALERKLIDRHGDLEDAVDRARALAGLHHGDFVRVDLTCEPKTWLQKQVSEAVKQLNPAARVVEALAPLVGAQMLELALRHPAEPLAVMPVELRVR